MTRLLFINHRPHNKTGACPPRFVYLK